MWCIYIEQYVTLVRISRKIVVFNICNYFTQLCIGNRIMSFLCLFIINKWVHHTSRINECHFIHWFIDVMILFWTAFLQISTFEELVTMNNSMSIIISNAFITNFFFTFNFYEPVSVDNSLAAMAHSEPGTKIHSFICISSLPVSDLSDVEFSCLTERSYFLNSSHDPKSFTHLWHIQSRSATRKEVSFGLKKF